MNFDIETETSSNRKKKNKNNKLYFLLLGSAIFVLIILLITYLVLISGNKSRKAPIQTPTTKTSKIKIYDEYSNDRPLAFMIDNNIGDAKHAGLQDSYLNYEIIVEGGLTRIMAIYKDRKVSLIGPIRSSRHYFLDYSQESDAIYSHYGWSPQAEEDIKKLSINNINGMTDQKPFRRDEKSVAPHNVFTSTTYIKDYLEKKDYSSKSSNWKLLNISSDEIKLDGESNNANKIVITYSSNQYRTYSYDESNKYYLRSQNGSPHLDRQTSEQLHYKNIIIMKVTNKTIDSSGRQDLTTIGSGTGYYITNGFYKNINWSKETRTSKTQYTYEDGKEVKLNDGNTFIQIVPINSNITIE